MKRMFRFTQNRRSAILLFSISLLLSSGLLAGCADGLLAGCANGLLAEDAPLPEARYQETPYQDYVSSKLRHAPLRERALGSAGTTSSGPVSLIIGLDETILEAARLVSRPRLVSRVTRCNPKNPRCGRRTIFFMGPIRLYKSF